MKKRKLNIWWKILIIICLFFLAGTGGYVYGMLTAKPVKKVVTVQKRKVKKEIIHNRMNQSIKLSNGLVLKIKSLDRYTTIRGLNNAVGLTIQIENKTKKAQSLPEKYNLNLLFDKKSLSSIGIYSADDLAVSSLKSITSKINPGETWNVVYMYKANEANDLNAYKAELTIKDANKQYVVSLPLDGEQFTGNSEPDEDTNTEITSTYHRTTVKHNKDQVTKKSIVSE